MSAVPEVLAVDATTEPRRGLMHLRFRGEGSEIDIDFEKAEDCRIVLAALGDYFGKPLAAPPEREPVAEPPPPAAPATSKQGPHARTRHTAVADWIAKQPHAVAFKQIMDAFAGEWPSDAACWQFLNKWLGNADCPIERAGRGFYRAKRGGGTTTATEAFRDAGGREPAAGSQADLDEVGTSCG